MKKNIINTLLLSGFAISAFSQTLVQDINSGLGSSEPAEKVIYNGELYFRADDGITGSELWKYDGTSSTLVQDIHPSGNSYPENFVVAGGILFFTANDGTTGRELWKYDGTTATLVQDIYPGISSNDFDQKIVAIGNTIYFRATDGVNGDELWKYDGTNLTMIDIYPGSGSSNPYGFTSYNGEVYFTANDGSNGSELWKYDGVNVSIIDVFAGVGSSFPDYLTEFNGELYFGANIGSGFTLQKYNGTTVSMVQSNIGNPKYLFVHENNLFFQAYDTTAVSLGYEPWKYDGTTASMIQDINPNANGNSNPIQFTTFDANLYFVADDATNGRELWKYDGITASMVQDINNSGHSMPSQTSLEEGSYLTVLGNHLYFTADDGTNGFQLWKFDGTNTTQMIINADSSDAYPSFFTVFNNELYFTAYDHPSYGSEMWKVQGTFNSVEENSPSVNIELYPNPTSGTIILKGLESIADFQIRNVLGELVLNGTTSNGQAINVEALPKGVYYVLLENSGNLKFIKQ